MNEAEPVIIVGAPRSGTSLLQKIIREHEGFCAVAKESDFIWRPYTHPKNNDWQCEGWRKDLPGNQSIERIRREFDRFALSSRTWRRASALNIMRYQRSPLLAPVLHGGYRLAALMSTGLWRSKRADTEKGRLVDKSVHFPLFLPLVNKVFPNARFIHIVRSGLDTVPSMLEGWLNPDRFFSYAVPGGLAIPDYPHSFWNFALPPNWQEWRARPLADVVTFQWLALQEAVIEHFDQPSSAPLLRIRLEDLVAEPRTTLEELADFIGLPQSSYLDRLSRGLPRVNASPRRQGRAMDPEVALRMDRLSNALRHRLKRTNETLGYK